MKYPAPTPVEIVDSAEIGRLASALDMGVANNLITIQAHCVVALDNTNDPSVRDLVGCISRNVLELAQRLSR